MSVIKVSYNRESIYRENIYFYSFNIVIHNCSSTSAMNTIHMKQTINHCYIMNYMNEICMLFDKDELHRQFHNCVENETITIDTINIKYFSKEKGFIVEIGYFREMKNDVEFEYTDTQIKGLHQEVQNVVKDIARIWFDRLDETKETMEQKKRLQFYLQNKLCSNTYDTIYV